MKKMAAVEFSGYLAGSGLAGAAGFVYFMEKDAAEEKSPLTEILDDIVKEAHVNPMKVGNLSQQVMQEMPRAMDIPRDALVKAAEYVEAIHGKESFGNRVEILKDMVKRANSLEVTSVQEDMDKEASVASVGAAMLPVFGIGAGLYAANKAGNGVLNAVNYSKFSAVFNYVVKHNTILKHEYEQNPKKIRSFAETIFNFSPKAALDPNVLASVLSNAAMGESIDPQTIMQLVNLDKGVQDVSNTRIPQIMPSSRIVPNMSYSDRRTI